MRVVQPVINCKTFNLGQKTMGNQNPPLVVVTDLSTYEVWLAMGRSLERAFLGSMGGGNSRQVGHEHWRVARLFSAITREKMAGIPVTN